VFEICNAFFLFYNITRQSFCLPFEEKIICISLFSYTSHAAALQHEVQPNSLKVQPEPFHLFFKEKIRVLLSVGT
jgi:hypothetical protein